MMTRCVLSGDSLDLQRQCQWYCLILNWFRLCTVRMHAHIHTHTHTHFIQATGTDAHTHLVYFLLQDLLPLLEQCEESDDVLRNDLIR